MITPKEVPSTLNVDYRGALTICSRKILNKNNNNNNNNENDNDNNNNYYYYYFK